MDKISLKAARVNANFTQKDAARELNISNKTLGNWENGTSFPPADMIPKICGLYRRPYDGINFLPNNSL